MDLDRSLINFIFSYVIGSQNVELTLEYKSLVTGSVVMLIAQATNSLNSAWSEKIGAWALLYFRHLSRHLMASVSTISNRILAFSVLKMSSIVIFGVKKV